MDEEGSMKTHLIKQTVLFFAAIIFTQQFSSAQWIQQNSTTPENLTDVVALDSMKAIAIGDRNGVLRTTDAGMTWVNQSAAISAVYNWNNISFSGALNGTIVGDQRVMTTADGGFTWTNRAVPSARKCLSVMQFSSANIYVGDDSGWIHQTIDTGKTWTSKKISQWPILSIFMWNTIVMEDLIFALTPASICEWRSYSPSSWKESIIKNFEGLGSAAFKGAIRYDGLTYVVGVQGDLRAAPTIIRRMGSPDTVWANISQGILHDGALYGISAPGATNTIYVCGDGGMLLKSSNGGDMWHLFTGLVSRRLKAVSFSDANHGFAVGDSGIILHTNNGGGIVVGVGGGLISASHEFALDQNYPNPFNPITAINYQIPVNSFVTVKVYDLLGREIATLVNEERVAGSYSVRWDGSSFPSGVYFYRLKAAAFSDTKKLLLLK